MKTVAVNGTSSYEVKIGAGLLGTLGEEVCIRFPDASVCILSDDTVFPLYGKQAISSLEESGIHVSVHVIPHGEASKTLFEYGRFLSFLAGNRLSRSDCLIALGGGVVGDLCGFTAATYLRGIPYIGVPTTLLSMVDSSVGGKTAIDLPEGKNLCGAFYPPSLVLCDTDTLSSMPPDVFSDGMAEVIKYGVLFDEDLITTLENQKRSDREEIVSRCVRYKKLCVEKDEFDRGERQLLNFGHTVGHAIELLSGYTVPHGHAVASGMVIITRAAEKTGFCTSGTSARLEKLLGNFGLPVNTEFAAGELSRAILSDKKRSGGTITLILPRKIGKCERVSVAVAECESLIARGLSR